MVRSSMATETLHLLLDSCLETLDGVRFVDVYFALEIAPQHIIQGTEIRRTWSPRDSRFAANVPSREVLLQPR
jgi:hypothetical protein